MPYLEPWYEVRSLCGVFFPMKRIIVYVTDTYEGQGAIYPRPSSRSHDLLRVFTDSARSYIHLDTVAMS